MKLTRRAFLGGALASAACAATAGSRGQGRRHDDRSADRLLFCGWLGAFPRRLEERLDEGRIGAVVIARQNTTSLAALVGLVERIRKRAVRPVLIAVTQEGGPIRPLVPEMTTWPAALSFGEGRSLDEASALAETAGRAMGDELRAAGIDINFAPVLDVNTNPANPIIGERAFGRDARTVAILAGAWQRGHAAAGMITCGKHFPGHGATDLDSHLTLPVVDAPLERLRAVDLEPFRALAPVLPMMMTAHVVYPALDPHSPATLSRTVLEVLHDQVGFRGVVITDDLEMRAITSQQSVGVAAVRAFKAGCRAFLVAHTPALQDEAAAALKTGVGRVFREVAGMVIDSFARRSAGPRPPLSVIGSAPHLDLAARIART